jgi:23S rRNA pseudouridine1911/1915/1917 synthase
MQGVPNRGYIYREQLGSEARGFSVLDWLSGHYRHASRATWAERIAAGEVWLEARVASAGEGLRPGQWLEWRRPPWEEPPVPTSVALLYRDPHVMALAKPRGLPTLPGGGFLEHTLLAAARRLSPSATPVHRLGRGTSGVVLLALGPEARRRLAARWREGSVEKLYRALVLGVPPDRLAIEMPIGPVPHARLGRIHAASASGRPARSAATLLEARGDVSLVEVRIDTGRPHQIRIHMAAAGHPLLGDPVYMPGGRPREDAGLPGDPGYALHAWRLSLVHPFGTRRLELECLPPPCLRTRGERVEGRAPSDSPERSCRPSSPR